MDAIVNFDTNLFLLINTQLTSPFLDQVMPYITQKLNFLGAIIVAAVLIMVLGKRQDRWGLLLLVIVVLTSDFICNILKHLIMRIRPCNAIESVRLLVGCSHSYSLPSGHSTNIFAAMIFLTTRYKKFFPLFIFIAVTVAYSRVYVGVHYPLDVTAGAFLGSSVALGYAYADKRFTPKVAEYYRKKRGGIEA